MNLKKARRALWPALALAGLMACLSGGTGAPRESGWYGVIRTTCGPADGPALLIRIEERPVADCGAPARPDTARGLYLMYVDRLHVDSLKPGMVIKDTLGEIEGSGDGSVLTLTVEESDAASVKGKLKVEAFGDRSPAPAATQGTIELKVCPRRFPVCG